MFRSSLSLALLLPLFTFNARADKTEMSAQDSDCNLGMKGSAYIEKIREYVRSARGDSSYLGRPFTDHLEEVVGVLNQHGIRDVDDEKQVSILAAAWALDAFRVEALDLDELTNLLGSTAGDHAWRVTRGVQGSARDRRNHPRAKSHDHEEALVILLANQIVHLRALKDRPRIQSVYLKHCIEFYKGEFRQRMPLAQPFWNEIEGYSKKLLHKTLAEASAV